VCAARATMGGVDAAGPGRAAPSSTVGPSELVFDALDSPIAVLDATGRIVAVNAAWERVATSDSAEPWKCGVGVSYLSVCDQAAGAFSEGAADVARGIRDVLAGRQDTYVVDYPCPTPEHSRWFNLRVSRLSDGAVCIHHDVTALRLAETGARMDDARLLRAFDESSPIFLLVDPDGTIGYVSQRTCELFGLDRESVVGASAFGFVEPVDAERMRETYERVAAVPGRRCQLRCRALDGQGRRRDVDVTVVNLLDDPDVRALAIVGTDVTDSRTREITTRLEGRLLQRFPAAVVITDDAGVIAYWNERAQLLTGVASADAVGRRLREIGVRAGDRLTARRIFESITATGRWEGEYEFILPDGTFLPLHLALERIDDDEIDFHGLVGTSIDISDRRRLEDELAFQALHDPLTGLPNRRRFVERAEHALGSRSTTTAIAFLDLDDFKELNDRVGHGAGDRALQVVAQRLEMVLRVEDVVARIGGDEFVAALVGVEDADEALAVAGRLLDAVRQPIVVEGQRVQLSGSVGVAVSHPGMGAEVLLRNADAAMYQAKEQGKNRVALFDDELRERTRARRAYAEQLRAAVADGRIHAHFQPQTSLATGAVVGFEALARWEDDDGVAGDSASFLAVAEEGGVVTDIDRVVLAETAAALGRFHAERPDLALRMSVNVSGGLLAAPELPELLVGLVREHALPPGSLCVEVVESALADADTVASNLRSLATAGIEVAIDDFGTGYSSLSRIQQFDVDELKIDKSFVAALGTDQGSDAVVVAIIGLARALGLRTVAEGVETEEQVRRLAELGVDNAQGFWWSPALPLEAAMDVVRAAPSTGRPSGSPVD